jgi:hypothetical protein
MLLIAVATSRLAGAAGSCPAATVCSTRGGNCTDVVVRDTVIGGSKAAHNQNAESVLFIRCEPLAARYTANWQPLARRSEPYVGRGMRQWGRSWGAGGGWAR